MKKHENNWKQHTETYRAFMQWFGSTNPKMYGLALAENNRRNKKGDRR